VPAGRLPEPRLQRSGKEDSLRRRRRLSVQDCNARSRIYRTPQV